MVKKSIISIIILCTIACTFLIFNVLASPTIESDSVFTDEYSDFDTAVERLDNQADDIDLYIIGDYEFTGQFTDGKSTEVSIETESITSEEISELGKKRSTDQLNMLVVSESVVNEDLKADGMKEKINKILDDGYLVYFMLNDLQTANDVAVYLTGDDIEHVDTTDDIAEDVSVYSMYIAKDKAGNYVYGVNYCEKDITKETKDKRMLYKALENKNIPFTLADGEETKLYLNTALKELINNDVSAGAGNGFSWGSGWTQVRSWIEDDYIVSRGTITFQKTFFFTEDAWDDYYACALKVVADPEGSSNRTKFVYVQHDMDKYGSYELFDYSPQVTGTSPQQYDVGVEVSAGTDTSISVSGSSSITIDCFSDQSSYTNELADVRWDLSNTSPAYGTSTYRISSIARADGDSTSMKFDTYIQARFTNGTFYRTISERRYSTCYRP